ncbi:MAG: hypothetical protein ACKVVP_03130 [Chloroflexota bacterium]
MTEPHSDAELTECTGNSFFHLAPVSDVEDAVIVGFPHDMDEVCGCVSMESASLDRLSEVQPAPGQTEPGGSVLDRLIMAASRFAIWRAK